MNADKIKAIARLLISSIAILPVAAYAATAQWKPEKPIEIVVGTGVGGGQDKSARTVQRILHERGLVDVAVTVVNKPGGGGAVGWTYLNQHAGEGNIVYVRGLDCLDETPLLDIKPDRCEFSPLAAGKGDVEAG